MKNESVTIGPSGYDTTVLAPRIHVGWWEGLTLTVRGWLDAKSVSPVADDTHTHTLHLLQARHRRQEIEVVRRVDHAISAVDEELAALEVVTSTIAEVPGPIPARAELEGMSLAERREWAERKRAAVAAHAAAAEVSARVAAATERAEVLTSIRQALVTEGQGVRDQWAEAYTERAARYTRARFGRGGGKVTATPAIAGYAHAPDPTVERRAADRRAVADARPAGSRS